MTSEYVIGLLGIFGSLSAGVALVWAIRHRQLRTEDEAMYKAIGDDEPDYTIPAMPVKPPSASIRWMFALALTLVLVLVGCLIVQTVRVSGDNLRPSPVSRR